MITLLVGDSTFEVDRLIARLTAGFAGRPERVDGSVLEPHRLADLVAGGTLFADKHLVIIRELSTNAQIWPEIAEWAKRVSADTHLVLIESKPDKRTRAYKDIAQMANVTELKLWTDKDGRLAETWVGREADILGISLDKKSIQHLVERVGVDQWSLYRALEKLALVQDVTIDVIDSVVEPNPQESVFVLFEMALRGDAAGISDAVATLRLSEDPYRTFGLLVSQAFNLAAVATADGSTDVAKDLGVHPYAVSKLSRDARRLGPRGARRVIKILGKADDDLKSSGTDPWRLIERALLAIVRV